MDSKNKRIGGFCEAIMATVPDFETYGINERCSAIQKILNTDDNNISNEHLVC